MTYQLRLSRRNKQQIEKLPGNIRNIARRRIVSLRAEPRPSDAKELGEHPGYFRVWLDANHRLVWQVDEDAKLVDVLYVGPKRPDLYGRRGLGRGQST